MDAAEVDAWDLQARARFTYRPDGPKDTWRSHADQVIAGEPWEDDCDGLAMTVLELLGRGGLDLHARFRLLVMTKPGLETSDHMVGCAVDEDGRFWVVGDTFGRAYRARDCRHLVVAYQRLDEWLPNGQPRWRGGAPWETAH